MTSTANKELMDRIDAVAAEIMAVCNRNLHRDDSVAMAIVVWGALKDTLSTVMQYTRLIMEDDATYFEQERAMINEMIEVSRKRYKEDRKEKDDKTTSR